MFLGVVDDPGLKDEDGKTDHECDDCGTRLQSAVWSCPRCRPVGFIGNKYL